MNNCKLLPGIYYNVNNNKELEEIITRIKELKLIMAESWEEKGNIDPEVTELSIKLDSLLNKYYALIKDNDGKQKSLKTWLCFFLFFFGD